MGNDLVLILAAAVAVAYGLVSRPAEDSVVTPPMAFTLAGLALGPLGLGLVAINFNNETVFLVATVALVVILASDASKVDPRRLGRSGSVAQRLLLVGLPLTMVLGAGLAWLLLPALGLAAAVLLALVLAPTDAALGQAVVSNQAVPETVRQAISVESGLNDGIALPPVFAVIFYLSAETGTMAAEEGPNWLAFAALQLLLGPVAGAVVGLGGGRLIELACRRGWIEETFQRLAMVALAVLAYALAEEIGGNGFIAAFVAGFTLAVKDAATRARMQEYGETTGTLFVLLVFIMLGLVMIPAMVPFMTWTTTVYALLSLTVIRMVPVAVAMAGMGVDWRTTLFLGWFGPRGIASILYLLLVVMNLGVPGYETLLATGVQTVALSVVLHGLTAAPLARRYARVMADHSA
jgi:NhaP-type Na+/H+ or K+/H+ antiporter